MKKLFSNFYKLKKILLSSLVLGSMTSVALVASCIDQTNPNLNKALSVVEPKNKQFKEWGDDSFLQKVNLNDLSYQKQADQVQFIAPFNKEKAQSHVMYQLTVYSFADGNNDGIGDFIGLKNNLDYFVKLGIDTLYLSPIFPASSYHGYDVVDYVDVAPELGGMQAFDEFLIAAHQNGIRVILDVPFNHTSYEHPWFQKALAGDEKYQKYYTIHKKPSHKNLERKDSLEVRKLFFNFKENIPISNLYWDSFFWEGMPELNLTNKDVKKEIEYVHKYWATKGVDGFRYDAFEHFFDRRKSNIIVFDEQDKEDKTVDIISDWKKVANKAIENNHPDQRSSSNFFMFGEWWSSVVQAKPFFGNFLHNALDTVIDGQYFKGKYNSVYISPNDEMNLLNSIGSAKWMPFLDNHDIERFINEVKWNFSRKGQKDAVTNKPTTLKPSEIGAYEYAMTSLLSRGGLPTLYDGNEILMQGGPRSGEGNGDYNIRESFNWGDENKIVYFKERKSQDLISKRASVAEPTIEQMMQDPNSSYNLVAKINKLRATYPSIKDQAIKNIAQVDEVFKDAPSLAYQNITVRKNDDGSFIVFVYGYEDANLFKETKNLVLKDNLNIAQVFINKNLNIKNNTISNSLNHYLAVFKVDNKGA